MPTSNRTIAYLSPGAAGMFCGSCMNDNMLVRALGDLGCSALLVPMYTPLRTDEPDASIDKIFYGGINVYLQQKLSLFRHLPPPFDRWLDSPRLIRWLTGRAVETDAKLLGPLAVSVIRGEQGRQAKEVRRLVDWLAADAKPDLVNYSNFMVAGSAAAVKKRLGVPVVVTLQGDDVFLDELAEPWRSQAMKELRKLAACVDGFLVHSDFYADKMADYFAIPKEKMHRVPLGVSLDDAPPAPLLRPADRPPTVGYLARICPAKGFHNLVDAFIHLRTLPGMSDARLHVAGWLGGGDRAYFDAQVEKLKAAGCHEALHHAGIVEREEKLAFLKHLDVLSVPTDYQEPKGRYLLEALACGVPVVQPEHGVFAELLKSTGGGRLTKPGDSEHLASTLHTLLTDHETRAALAAAGHEGVRQRHSAAVVAQATLAVYEKILAG